MPYNFHLLHYDTLKLPANLSKQYGLVYLV